MTELEGAPAAEPNTELVEAQHTDTKGPRTRTVYRGAPVPKTDNMWTFTAGAIILMFLLYIVKVGSFKKWTQILYYNPTATPTTDNPNPTPSGGSSGAGAAQSPSTNATGPDAAHPNIASGQSRTDANSKMNSIFGVPFTQFLLNPFGTGK